MPVTIATNAPSGSTAPKNGMCGRPLRRAPSRSRALKVPSSPSELTQ